MFKMSMEHEQGKKCLAEFRKAQEMQEPVDLNQKIGSSGLRFFGYLARFSAAEK